MQSARGSESDWYGAAATRLCSAAATKTPSQNGAAAGRRGDAARRRGDAASRLRGVVSHHPVVAAKGLQVKELRPGDAVARGRYLQFS